MSKILFACFHDLEMGTVVPVASQLSASGHETAFLALYADVSGAQDFAGPVFRCGDVGATDDVATASVDCRKLLRELIGPTEDAFWSDQMLDLVASLHPGLQRTFPLRVEQWVPRWSLFVQGVFESWSPDVVVISLGQIETPIVRRACTRHNVPCLFLLVPFYEFKTVERLSRMSHFNADDEYCVAGEEGKRRLLRIGIPEAQISITGAPIFDALTTLPLRGQTLPGTMILYTHQRVPENDRLNDRLLRYVSSRPGTQLIVRPHPSAPLDERALLENEISSRDLSGSVRLSKAGSRIADDLAVASVIVTISSLSIHEAMQVGVPAICWWPSFLPMEVSVRSETQVQVVRTYRELERALDRSLAMSNASSEHREFHQRVPCHLGGETATERVCRRILSKVPTPESTQVYEVRGQCMAMNYALAILTFVPAHAPPGTKKRLPTALESLSASAYDGPLYIVDDGSTDDDFLAYLDELSARVAVVRRLHNGGISRAKNTCLRVLSEAGVEVGFVAEDDVAFSAGWLDAYLRAHEATKIHHFSWAWDEDPSGEMQKEIREFSGFPITATTRVNGVFLSFTQEVLRSVGGFRIMPAAWGHEHTNWTNRIIKAGLAPYFADIVDSNKYIHINCYGYDSAVNVQDRANFSQQNKPLADDLTTIFWPLTE